MIQKLSKSETIITEHWIKANWEDFINLTNNYNYEKGRFYYDQGWMKIEMSPIGISHAQDNNIIGTIITLYTAIKNIPIKGLTNVSYRQLGIREVQPDLSYYIGNKLPQLPRNNSPINLNEISPPNLVIEIGSTSFLDDLGKKRLLYEQLEIGEYWVINVAESEIIAFTMKHKGSYQTRESNLLKGLSIDLVEEGLKRAKNEDDTAITRWLMKTFQS
ncbi:MAG: Uma2 family endonuclease [Crocosphaera sp.]